MHASGDQLAELTTLVDSGTIHPVIDRVFPFTSTKEALAYVDQRRATGKVVITMKPPS
jgi:NADPH:quinone reductase-like Zn-dependent oxidoreductase